MKKLLVLFLLAAMLCLTGCVGNIENPENLATSDVLQIKLMNVWRGASEDTAYFTKEQMEAAKRVVFFGSIKFYNDETSLSIPADKFSVHSTEIKAEEKDSNVIFNVPYEGLKLGKEYNVSMENLRIALEGDTPVAEENAVPVIVPDMRFIPVRRAATPTPVPEIPATGDSMNFAFLAVLAAAGMIGMTVLLRRKNEA
ncbi:MAG: LPXTG cell wall anchor domain-containing protein [Clostridia bacterium]|nr:LPXTG cell wall anchor domain-containing protein [Clostridia bacterium]